ncbi:endo-1,4-beta-xylanase [Aporhodopirellula aestuarii]|uniref:endo-1,4-beta-xylanase n=1 Tax=Aporhodopirellula aestuarii TaxID=2950107 RepID=A0ABT0U5W5_9BACT|nr:endo-1,4-beta-xylanase [Aporhodopirellula aestuarii]MCM2372246.1 endo-1,4-beta-xylanase [Aporhodopirellula aestuarii]
MHVFLIALLTMGMWGVATIGHVGAGELPVVTLCAEASQTHEVKGFSFDGCVAVLRSGDATQPLTVNLKIEGTAENGLDYEYIPREIRFAGGEKVHRIAVHPISDDQSEDAETVVLSLLPDNEAYRLEAPSRRSVTVTIAGEIAREIRGETLLFEQSSRAAEWVGKPSSQQRIAVFEDELPFATAEAVRVDHEGNPWEVALRWPLENTVGVGDEILVNLFARATSDSGSNASGKFTVRLQHDRPPYNGSEKVYWVGSEWKPILMRTTVTELLPGGESSLSIRLGYGKQNLEIGGLQFWNFGRTPPPHLPEPIHTYDGRRVDARWRDGLAEQTQRVRCQRVQFRLDKDHDPASRYRLRLVKAEYEIGTAVNANWVAPTTGKYSSTEDAHRYQAFVKKNFDRVTDENSQQWAAWEQNPKRAIETAVWAIENGLTLRGHSVFWGDPIKWPSPPDLWTDYQKTLASRRYGKNVAMTEMRRRIAAHLRENALVALSGNIPGTPDPIIAQWDVLNHPILHDRMWEITGWEFLRAAIREARTLANPKTQFFVNEDQVLSRPGHPNADPLSRLLQSFLEAQVPIDGVGFQCHFKSDQLPAIASIRSTLQRFAKLGLQLHVTEFDVDNDSIDSQTQADFTRDFLDLLAADDAVTSTTVWGFWEGEHWRSEEGAAMIDKGWNLRPNGQVFLDHVDRGWHDLRLPAPDAGTQMRHCESTLRRGNYDVQCLNSEGHVQQTWRITVSRDRTEFDLITQ